MRRRVFGIIRKEFIHIFRDVRTLLILIAMPIMMIVLYGYAITLDIRNIAFAVIDNANTAQSRELIDRFAENDFFILNEGAYTAQDVDRLFAERTVSFVLVFGKDFQHEIIERGSADLQLLIDASDSNVGTYINNYATEIINKYNTSINRVLPMAFTVEPRILYNPSLESSLFFVPGLVALILMLISALLTSITISREKETGTMEQILVSPVRPIEILIGKVVPYIALGLFNAAMILVFAKILFAIPFQGSLWLLFLLTLVYVFTALAFGLMISTVAPNQMAAMLMTLMATILPTIMLSGFIFPIASMPDILQYISTVIPATHYLKIIRGILLKGVGLESLYLPAIILTAIGVFLVAVASKRFNTTLEG
ncbi:MAG: ABC transporter [Ectothiorhodospiraceae bacterium]|nr:ABC transporter [Ectothiorhodospiraceae bacterium]